MVTHVVEPVFLDDGEHPAPFADVGRGISGPWVSCAVERSPQKGLPPVYGETAPDPRYFPHAERGGERVRSFAGGQTGCHPIQIRRMLVPLEEIVPHRVCYRQTVGSGGD